MREPGIEAVWPEAPAKLAAISARALASKPEDRYATALEFAQEMGEALVSNPFLEEGNQVTFWLISLEGKDGNIAWNKKTGALPADFHYAETQNTYSLADFVRRYLRLEGPAFVVSSACSASAKVFAASFPGWERLEALREIPYGVLSPA